MYRVFSSVFDGVAIFSCVIVMFYVRYHKLWATGSTVEESDDGAGSCIIIGMESHQTSHLYSPRERPDSKSGRLT